MKRLVLAAALTTVLAGCASTPLPPAPQAAAPAETLSLPRLTYTPVQVYNKPITVEQPINGQSQIIEIDGVRTPVAAWKLPEYGAHEVQLDSFVQRSGFGYKAQAFMAEVWLLDSSFKPIKKLPASRLDYSRTSLFASESLTERFIIDNRKALATRPAYLVVATTAKARQQKIQIANLDREYARVKGVMPPPTPDVFATAAEEGTLRLTITPLGGYQPMAAAPAQVPAEQAVAPGASIPKKASPPRAAQLEQVSQQFLKEVAEAIERKDITAAMASRRALKQTYSDLQALFESRYGSNPQAPSKAADDLDRLARSYTATGTRETLDAYLKQALILALQQGNAQSALALLDRCEQLIGQVDRLF